MMILLVIINIGMIVALVALFRAVRTLRTDLAHHDALLPLLTEAVETCKEQARLMALVKEIAAQFHSASGLSMKDAMDRLDAAAKEQLAAAEFLKAGVREDRHKAELDREQLQRLLVELHRLTIKVESNMAAVARIEVAADGVANDLMASQKRADEVVSGDPGAAADAGAQSQKEKDNND